MLTDLPNKRSAHDTLTRFVAQASRSLTPVAGLVTTGASGGWVGHA